MGNSQKIPAVKNNPKDNKILLSFSKFLDNKMGNSHL